MILHNWRVFQEIFLLFSGVGFVLEESSGKLTEDVGILSHEHPRLDIFLLVALGFDLGFLHNKTYKRICCQQVR